MKRITTIILGAVSLLMAIIISAVESGSDSNGGRSSYLVRFDEDKVERVTLMRGGQSVVMKKLDKYWFFVSPDQDRINTNSMEALLDKLNHLSVLDRLEADELVGEMSPANLGLEGDEALHVQIDSIKEGKPQVDKVLIGRVTPQSNSIYASTFSGKNSKGAVVVNGNPHDILDGPYDTLLERQLVNVPTSALVQIAVQTAGSNLVLQRNINTKETTPWILTKPVRAKADQDKVEELLASIEGLQIMDVEAVEKTAMKIPTPLPENAAVIQFRVLGSEKPIVLYLNKFTEQTDSFGPPLLSARISNRPATYRLNSMFLSSRRTIECS